LHRANVGNRGEWGVGSQERREERGEWRVESGEWRVGNTGLLLIIAKIQTG